MKKLILIIFSLVVSNMIIAQTDAICIYKITKNKSSLVFNEKDDIATQNAKNLINGAIEIAETFKYTLKFNENESVFSLNQSMKNEAQSSYLHPIAKALVGKGIYYQNIAQNESIHQVKISGGIFLIKDSFLTDWEITQDQKMIGKYLCFRAIKQCKSCNTADEVWFTPEIAIPFGPLGYSGLPGLILEVKKKTITLRLASIDFKPKNIVIKKPSKGKIVTKDEYKKITDGFRSQMKQY
jgi:GLPGLI family protein